LLLRPPPLRSTMGMGSEVTGFCSCHDAWKRTKLVEDVTVPSHKEGGESEEAEETPSTATPPSFEEREADYGDVATEEEDQEEEEGERQLGPGLFPPPAAPLDHGPPPPPPAEEVGEQQQVQGPLPAPEEAESEQEYVDEDFRHTREETVYIFDWDDTVLPSSWIQSQQLRLDRGSNLTKEQRQCLGEAARAAAQTLRYAKKHGTVVLVTNAERGWIELSCQKFLPTLQPLLEDVRMVSARTTYEGPGCEDPLDWKLRAFDVEIERHFTREVLQDPLKRKNVFSLGDSVHEREALLTAASVFPNCCSKSLKFMERPDIQQLCTQHELISGSFERMTHHDGNLDLCIRCP